MAEIAELRSQGKDDATLWKLVEDWVEDNPTPRATVFQVADHIDYVKSLIGVEYIGIGGGFDGMPPGPGPVGLDDVSTYPNLFSELIARGYSDEELRLIAGGNFLRVFSEVERIGEKMRATKWNNTVAEDQD